MLLKTYADDLSYAERLVSSFNTHNRSAVPLWVIVPESELSLFRHLDGANVHILPDTPFVDYFVSSETHGLRPGYINQEIVKLAFWELGLTDSYFCVDSDAVFIRDFFQSDFVHDDGNPYTVLVEDNELVVEPRYFHEFWKQREVEIRRIQELVGLEDRIMRTCHGHQIFSSAVLASFKNDYLGPRDWTYSDALAESPYEFSWYNMWLQHTKPIPIHIREPLVKVFHHEGQHLEYILRGITKEDIARGYLAVVVNSNYSRRLGLVSVDTPKPQALAPYLSYGELWHLAQAKIRDTLQRRFRPHN